MLCYFVDVLKGDWAEFGRALRLVRDGLLGGADQVTRLVVRDSADNAQVLGVLVEILEVVIGAQGA